MVVVSPSIVLNFPLLALAPLNYCIIVLIFPLLALAPLNYCITFALLWLVLTYGCSKSIHCTDFSIFRIVPTQLLTQFHLIIMLHVSFIL